MALDPFMAASQCGLCHHQASMTADYYVINQATGNLEASCMCMQSMHAECAPKLDGLTMPVNDGW
jgi:hypothetical protein